MASLEFLSQNGYWILFLTVLAEQLGLPIPAVPVLVAVGAMAGIGKLSLWLSLVLAIAAALVADTIWYGVGWAKGKPVLKLVCKISLEPDSCISDAKDQFQSMGSMTVLLAKFIPGISTVAPAMAGLSGMPLPRFLALDSAGSVAWAGAPLVLGFVFHDQLQRVMDAMSRFGSLLGIAVLSVVVAYVAAKSYQRYRFIRFLRSSRITPGELRSRMDSNDAPAVLDLRRAADLGGGVRIPGAHQFQVSELRKRHEEIPRGRDIVLYCSCPNEATSARLALLLKRIGIHNVHLLEGGFDAWTASGFAVEPILPVAAPELR